MRQLTSPEQFDDGVVNTRVIRDASVTEAKIADSAVTRAKIGNDVYGEYIDPPVTPMVAGATGTKGQFCYVSPYVYICVATNVWVRVTSESSW